MAVKKAVYVFLALTVVSFLTGCGKKQQPLEEMQEPMSIESLGALPAQGAGTEPAQAQAQAELLQQAPATRTVSPAAASTQLESLPPAGPYKPTDEQIQSALKNAGYYTGAIDGKIGPLSKKAIEEFQKASNLTVDGKVGPKTWAVLKNYLNPEPAAVVQSEDATGLKTR